LRRAICDVTAVPLLVDGHNLIGQMPGLNLADEDDEAQLVMLLRRYTTAKRGRQAIVVFDRGIYGHPQRLNGYGVTCHFARSPGDADAQIIKRLSTLQRPRDWTVVTSDRQVARAAQERGVRVISSQAFARQLLGPPSPAAPPQHDKPDIQLSDAEVEEWLQVFGEQPAADAAPPPAPATGQPDVDTNRAKPRKGRRGR
jgi:predicted RNA-binding protein with PIN domain